MHKKILFLIGHFGVGGKERQLVEMILGLPTNRFESFLFMKSSVDYFENAIDGRILEIKNLNVDKFKISHIIHLWRFINRIDPHIVFSLSKTTSHFAFFIKILSPKKYRLINASIRNSPIIFTFYQKIERVLYNMYKEIIANSIAGMRAYQQLGKKRRHILYNGFDMNKVPIESKKTLRKKLGLKDIFTVIMVGSMGVRKDQTTFIRAANEVLKTGVKVQFILLGDGPKRNQYVDYVEELDIKNEVKILGEVVDNVTSYFKASDISVLTSSKPHGEGIPNVIIESMACGTPVIASDNGGTKEILQKNYNGLIINCGDELSLLRNIMFLYNNPFVHEKYSKNAINTIINKFTRQIMINNLISILNIRN